MKKHYFRSAVAALLPLLLIAQPVEACTGFIIGKKLTADGSTLVGRTEDLEPNHNKNFVVRERVYNKKGAIFEDAANGFQYPVPESSCKYTAVPYVTPDQGIFDEAGFNEYGVSISATVSASANDKIQKDSINSYVTCNDRTVYSCIFLNGTCRGHYHHYTSAATTRYAPSHPLRPPLHYSIPSMSTLSTNGLHAIYFNALYHASRITMLP